MNREFRSTSKSSRLAFAIAAASSTLLVISGIDGLAGDYGAPAAEMAAMAYLHS